MSMYLIRLDDASEYMNLTNWKKMEQLLLKYNIKPIVGVIPKDEDNQHISQYNFNENFWSMVHKWQSHGWDIAMHGYNHKYLKIKFNNVKSEFIGLGYNEQSEKITKALEVFQRHDLKPRIFFAPAHSFNEVTIDALLNCSDIRVINDTIANDVYKYKDIYFIPQQAGSVRRLPFRVVTFCYHPNTMADYDFNLLENFIVDNQAKFISFQDVKLKNRKKSLFDKLLVVIYQIYKSLKRRLND